MESNPKPTSKFEKMFRFRYILIACLGLLVSYAIFDRTIPVDVRQVIVVNRPLPGQDAIIRIEVYRNKLCYTRVEKAIFDGDNVKTNVVSQSFQVVGNEGYDLYSVKVPVDINATPGKGNIRIVNIWVCNYVHIIWPLVVVRDVPFTISSPADESVS